MVKLIVEGFWWFEGAFRVAIVVVDVYDFKSFLY